MTIRKTINIILAWLLIFSLIGTLSLFIMLNANQSNGKVVNYTGIVRGGVQRLIKLEMAEKDTSELMAKIEKIMQGLLHGDSDLKIPVPKDANFIHQMQSVETFWKDQLKPKILSYKEDKNFEALITSSEEFFELTNQGVNTAEEFSSQGIQYIKLVNVIIFLLNALCIILISFIIYKKILIPIREIQRTAEELSEGQLKTTLVYSSNDELGHLANSMRSTQKMMEHYIDNISDILNQLSQGDMKIKIDMDYQGDFGKIKTSLLDISNVLRKTMMQIGAASDEVFDNSDQVSHGSQALSQGATEQAGSIEELTATIDIISSQVKKTAENAAIAQEKSTALGNEMLKSDTQMTQMLKAMKNINQSAQEINKIIKTIEDIAFQTNILALNASVEAARAGASGKGFAVVADEVRNLASKSAKASKNTSTLIETSIAAVNHGTQIANTTANTLIVAVKDAKEVTEIIEKISEASHYQAQSINQVTQGMGEISSIVQMNSATAEESAAASIELSNQAQVMKTLVRKFKF